MGLLPIPAPRLTQGASRAGFWRAAALYVCAMCQVLIQAGRNCGCGCWFGCLGVYVDVDVLVVVWLQCFAIVVVVSVAVVVVVNNAAAKWSAIECISAGHTCFKGGQICANH